MPDVSVKPGDAYRLFAGLEASAPIPDGVTDLQANGAVWQDFTVCCRFTATREVIDAIVANGYAQTDWATIAPDMIPREYIDAFRSTWSPESLLKAEFYTKQVEQDHSTDSLHLVVDRQQGLVYAVGKGSVHP